MTQNTTRARSAGARQRRWARAAAAIVAAAGLVPGLAAAAGGGDILAKQCAECHALQKPAAPDLERLHSRKGPDLYYAGSKFQREWLVRWLQDPTPIRPAGVAYFKVVKAAEPGATDAVDATKVPGHVKLPAADAAAVADALAALGADAGLVQKGAWAGEPPNAMMAGLLFSKLRGCSSCHGTKPGEVHSGPELHDAGDRLQPDFIVEYIRDPQKFDPHVWMPRLELNPADVQKLAGYLVSMKSGGAK